MQSSSRQLFDDIRKKWVAATPEEIVRQSLVHKMTDELGYPKELIAIEKALKELPHVSASSERRADIICFAKEIHPDYPLYPLLLIECKEKGLGSSAQEQLIGYNHLVKAPFIALASQEGIRFGYFDRKRGNYHFISSLPSYSKSLYLLRYGKIS